MNMKVKQKAIVVDLDGTYSLVGNRSPYDGKKTFEVDLPNVPVIDLVNVMRMAGYRIIFLSGRNENARVETQAFIHKYGGLEINDYDLHLKPNNDYRKDFLHKGEIYRSLIEPDFDVLFALEDRPSMIDFYRNEIGIACFGVTEYKSFNKKKGEFNKK